MIDNKTENLLKELVKDWTNQKLTSFSAMIVVSGLINPPTITALEIDEAKKQFIARQTYT